MTKNLVVLFPCSSVKLLSRRLLQPGVLGDRSLCRDSACLLNVMFWFLICGSSFRYVCVHFIIPGGMLMSFTLKNAILHLLIMVGEKPARWGAACTER